MARTSMNDDSATQDNQMFCLFTNGKGKFRTLSSSWRNCTTLIIFYIHFILNVF